MNSIQNGITNKSAQSLAYWQHKSKSHWLKITCNCTCSSNHWWKKVAYQHSINLPVIAKSWLIILNKCITHPNPKSHTQILKRLTVSSPLHLTRHKPTATMAVQHRDPHTPTKKKTETKGYQNGDTIGMVERTVDTQASSWQQKQILYKN